MREVLALQDPEGKESQRLSVLEPVGQRAALKGERESQMTARRAERSRARGQLWPGAEASRFTLYHLMEPRPTLSLSLSLPSGHSRTPARPHSRGPETLMSTPSLPGTVPHAGGKAINDRPQDAVYGWKLVSSSDH